MMVGDGVHNLLVLSQLMVRAHEWCRLFTFFWELENQIQAKPYCNLQFVQQQLIAKKKYFCAIKAYCTRPV